MDNGLFPPGIRVGIAMPSMVDPGRMAAHIIRPVDLKLARAKAQAQMLSEAIGPWSLRNPNVTTRCELREARMGYRLIVDGFAEPPPLEDWSLQVGEWAHNLRSALDNLAFALARLRCDPPPNPGRIAFPISIDKSKFEREARPTLEQMSDPAAQLVEKLQPFNRDGSPSMGTPESDALVILQWLNNADKHRVPSVILVGQMDATHEGSIEYYSEEDAKANTPPDTTVWGGPLAPGVVLLELRTKNSIAKVSGRFNVRGTVAIETNNGHPALILVIQSLTFYAAVVVDQFRAMFAG